MSHNRPPPQTPASSFCFIVTLLIALFNPPGAAIFLCFQIFKEGDFQKLKRLFPQQFEGLIDNSIFHVNNKYNEN